MKSKRWCRGSVNFLKWFDVFEKWRTTDTVLTGKDTSAGFTQQGFSLWVLSSEIVLRSDFLCLRSFFKVTLHSHHLPHHVWYWYQELKCKFSLIGLVRWKFTPLCTQDILQASCIFGYSCVVSTIQIKGFVKPLVSKYRCPLFNQSDLFHNAHSDFCSFTHRNVPLWSQMNMIHIASLQHSLPFFPPTAFLYLVFCLPATC